MYFDYILYELIPFLVIFGLFAFLVNRVYHYRNLWIQAKSRVSWTMPSPDPWNWVVIKNYSTVPRNARVSYDVADKDTKARVAQGFVSEIDAYEYIVAKRGQGEESFRKNNRCENDPNSRSKK